MFDGGIDPEILLEFIDESLDSLETLPEMFIALEKNPHDLEIVNAIFRPVHSIKGNSAFFGMLQLKNLTHEMETTLDLCRKHELLADKKVIDILLRGLDAVTEIFNQVRDGNAEVEDELAFQALLEDIISSQQTESVPAAEKARELLWKIRDTNCLEGTPQDDWLLEAICSIEELCLSKDSHENLEDVTSANTNPFDVLLDIVSEPPENEFAEEVVEEFTEKLNSLKELISEESQSFYDGIVDEFTTFSMTVGFDGLLADILKERLIKLRDMQPEDLTFELVDNSDLEDAIDEVPQVEVEKLGPLSKYISEPEKIEIKDDVDDGKVVKVASKSMRVPENTIDEFLNFVGELIVAREMYDHLRQHFEDSGVAPELTTELRRYTDNFRQVSGELERTCMNIRKQPIKGILQKLPRIVRDVAGALGKGIEVHITGDDISVDKSLIGSLEDPLVHIIRNSADHGIELPEERRNSGKSEAGVINVDVTEDDEFLYTLIKDDGKGLNYPALKEKGVSMGLFDEHSQPSEEEIAQVIFSSGVSTAQKVTDISGRGVGMDVVKRYIEGAGGTIQLRSVTGEGTELTITMRKSITTQIIDGLILRLEETCYVIPLKYVVESFPPTVQNFSTVFGQIEHIKRHDSILPVIRLNEMFEDKIGERKHDEGILIVINFNGRRAALLVDEVINIQQVVLKPLKGLHLEKNLFTGGALRGDGYISLILDIENIITDEVLHLEEAVNN